jgi:hypothetical protein
MLGSSLGDVLLPLCERASASWTTSAPHAAVVLNI